MSTKKVSGGKIIANELYGVTCIHAPNAPIQLPWMAGWRRRLRRRRCFRSDAPVDIQVMRVSTNRGESTDANPATSTSFLPEASTGCERSQPVDASGRKLVDVAGLASVDSPRFVDTRMTWMSTGASLLKHRRRLSRRRQPAIHGS